MLFENNDNYFDLINVYPKYNNVSEDDELFNKGNMFKEEYKAYKNYTVNIYKPKTKKDELLYNIMKYTFMINDYNLYLDLHYDNKDILNKYKEANLKLQKYEELYEKEYGPLNINSSNYNTFRWIESPWPWDKEDGKYV